MTIAVTLRMPAVLVLLTSLSVGQFWPDTDKLLDFSRTWTNEDYQRQDLVPVMKRELLQARLKEKKKCNREEKLQYQRRASWLLVALSRLEDEQAQKELYCAISAGDARQILVFAPYALHVGGAFSHKVLEALLSERSAKLYEKSKFAGEGDSPEDIAVAFLMNRFPAVANTVHMTDKPGAGWKEWLAVHGQQSFSGLPKMKVSNCETGSSRRIPVN